MRLFKPSAAYSVVFTVNDPGSGAAINADSTPTAIAYKAGVNDSANFALTVTNITTGVYKITGTVYSGYVAGDEISIVASATVGGTTANSRVDAFVVDTKRLSDSLTTADSSGVTTLLSRIGGAITLSAGAVTVGTNNDKTGYSLSQSFPTNFSSLAITGGGAVTAGTVSDKTSYKLASDGLDSVATTAPTGVASNFREMLVQVWRRFFKKAVIDSGSITTYADNGTTVLTTQTSSDTSTSETQGAAT